MAFLVAPLSIDDTLQAKNVNRWRNVQSDFENIFYSINTQKDNEDFDFNKTFEDVMKNEIKSNAETYKITYLNGRFPGNTYRFTELKQTSQNATVAYKLYDASQDGVLGILLYDVNGAVGPNVWGKDVFGLNIYPDRFEPFCKNDPVPTQKKDCSKSGTGLCCSNYYLIGGSIN